MKTLLEETVEQLTGKPAPKPVNPSTATTSGLKEIAPQNLFAEVLKQALGTPLAPQQLEQRKKEEAAKQEQGIAQVKALLASQKTKSNQEIINPPSPKPLTPPAYITGKPEYQPEKLAAAQKEQKKDSEGKKLPPLVEPSTHPKRGSWLTFFQRKKKSPEIKLGPSG